MKLVCFVIDSITIGGAEKLTLDVIGELAKKNTFKINLIILKEVAEESLLELIPDNVEYLFYDIFKFSFIKRISGLASLLKKYELVHSSMESANLYCSLAKIFSFSNTKYIATIHGVDGVFFTEKYTKEAIKKNGWKYFFLIKYLQNFTFKFYDRFIAVCFDTKNFLIKQRKISSKKIEVIYHGINVEVRDNYKDFDNSIRQEYNIAKEDFLIGYVGRLAYSKGLEYLIDEFYELVKHDSSFKLMIVGDGILRKELEEKINHYKINDNCCLIGSRKNVDDYYKNFDLYLLPSFSESTNLTVLEAMFNKTLTLSSDAGGLKEIIKDGENGFIFETGNFKEMKNKILHIFENRYSFEKLKIAGYETILEKFNLTRNVNKIFDFIRMELIRK